MDPLEIRIIKHDGKAVTLKLAEKEAVDQALHALADDGYLILRKATKPITSGEPITEDLLWNKVRFPHQLTTMSKTFLSSSRPFFSPLRMATSGSPGVSSSKSVIATKG